MLIQHLLSDIQSAEYRLQQFKERFDVSPLDAFEWRTDDAIEAAATTCLYPQVVDLLEKGNSVAAIKKLLLDYIVINSRRIESSTSKGSNMKERALLAAHSRLYTRITDSEQVAAPVRAPDVAVPARARRARRPRLV